MGVESFNIGKYEEVLSMTLITNLKNTSEIKKEVLNGDIDVVLINPELILDVFQVVVAATKALYNLKKGQMITKTLQSEVLFSLSSSKNITSSFKKFGISDSQENVLLAEIHLPGEEKITKVLESLRGVEVPLNQLNDLSNKSEIMKVYGIKEKELTASSLLDSVVTRIAVRDLL